MEDQSAYNSSAYTQDRPVNSEKYQNAYMQDHAVYNCLNNAGQ